MDIVGRKEKIEQHFHLDFSTGDKITPKEMNLDYETFLNKEKISILSYNIETVISEKLETALSRGEANTRMKNYYDIVLIRKSGKEINEKILVEAFKETTSIRETSFLYEISDVVIESLASSIVLKDLWMTYKDKYSFVSDVTYEDCIDAIRYYTNIVI